MFSVGICLFFNFSPFPSFFLHFIGSLKNLKISPTISVVGLKTIWWLYLLLVVTIILYLFLFIFLVIKHKAIHYLIAFPPNILWNLLGFKYHQSQTKYYFSRVLVLLILNMLTFVFISFHSKLLILSLYVNEWTILALNLTVCYRLFNIWHDLNY